MDANRLGDAIKSAIDGVGDKTDRQALFRALAEAIITEISQHADFSGGILGTEVSHSVTGTCNGVGPGAVF